MNASNTIPVTIPQSKNQQNRGSKEEPSSSIENMQNMPSRNPYGEYLTNLKSRNSSNPTGKPNLGSGEQVPASHNFSSQNVTNPFQNNPNQFSMNSNQTNNQLGSSQPNHQFPSNQNNPRYNRGNPQPPIDNSNYMWGYKITVEMLKNYNRSKPIKITVILK